MINRILSSELERWLFKGKVLILYGARQTGKTTLVKQLLAHHEGVYYNADEPDVRLQFTQRTSSELARIVGTARLIVIDEAQRIENIGLTLKLLSDTLPHLQVIATGSSSFELADRIKEPLTGRKFEFLMTPLSLEELEKHSNPLEADRFLSQAVLYGLYPEPALSGKDEARERLMELANSTLYKDVLLLGAIRNPEALDKLLRALALQVGQEVSHAELSGLLGLDKNTVDTYIRVLEQAFILFRLAPFSRNLRNEMKKHHKVYFWDNGIRNAVINNFTPMETRTDAGALWENLFVAERIKFLKNRRSNNRTWFWRTYQQQEIDYVEERDRGLLAAEIKTSPGKGRIPLTFRTAYPSAETQIITKENWRQLVYAPT